MELKGCTVISYKYTFFTQSVTSQFHLVTLVQTVKLLPQFRGDTISRKTMMPDITKQTSYLINTSFFYVTKK